MFATNLFLFKIELLETNMSYILAILTQNPDIKH